jgi:type I restriction enzyme S subunit
MSTAEQKPELPTGWKRLRLDEVAAVRLGRQRSPKNHHGTHMRPYLRAANVTWSGIDLTDVLEMNFTEAEMGTFRLQSGDILVNEASGSPAEVGKAAMFHGEIQNCAFQNTTIRVRPLDVNGRYILHFLTFLALSGTYIRGSRGVGINHIGVTAMAATPIPFARLDEQHAIVERLEDHLSRLDAALKSIDTAAGSLPSADRAASLAAQLRRSLLHAAFTGELTKNWREAHHG